MTKEISYSKDKTKSVNMALNLVDELELFHDNLSQTYTTLPSNITIRLSSEAFENWLDNQFWLKHGALLPGPAKDAVLSVMEGKAKFDGQMHSVFTRIGVHNSDIYVDLADDDGHVVRLNEHGWEVLTDCPIKFLKTNQMQALPLPIHGGDLSLLWKYVNIPESDRLLVLAWILECFRVDTDYPILILHGIYGSAKSTTQELICKLIDPSVVNLRCAPNSKDSLMVAIANSHIVSFNNMSKLNYYEQDVFCCLATGGGIGSRKFYTNHEELILSIKRPVIMNGINNFVTAPDLVSRCISIELDIIDDRNRLSSKKLSDDFIIDYPNILGGLYDLLNKVKKELPITQLSSKPRMADFALLGTALERVMGFKEGTFIELLKDNASACHLNNLSLYPILEELIEYIAENQSFSGTYSQLLKVLQNNVQNKRKFLHQPGPQTGQGLAHLIKARSTTLEDIGLSITFYPIRTGQGMKLEIMAKPDLKKYLQRNCTNYT